MTTLTLRKHRSTWGVRRAAVIPPDVLRRLYLDEGMSQKLIGRIWMMSDFTVASYMQEYGIRARPISPPHMRLEKHPRWRGSAATYSSKHNRIKRSRGTPRLCADCGTTDPRNNYDWACLDWNYDNPDSYRRLCRKCHQRRDDSYRLAKYGVARPHRVGLTYRKKAKARA